MQKRLLFCTMVLASSMAAAQTAARLDPADPKAAAPVRGYESAFKGYRPYADEEAGRWRESNEEMGRLGGHQGHLPQSAAAPPKPGAKPPAHAGRGVRK